MLTVKKAWLKQNFSALSFYINVLSKTGMPLNVKIKIEYSKRALSYSGITKFNKKYEVYLKHLNFD